MSKFKAGDKVGYKDCDGEVQGPYVVSKVVGTEVWFTKGTWMRASRLEFWHNLVRPEPAQGNDWSYAKADALLEAATKAIAEYNEYIQRKPSTYYGSISIVGTRIEPQVEVHDGDC